MAPGVTGLRPVSGAAKGSMIAAGIAAVLALITALLNLGAVDTAEDFLDGRATSDELTEAMGAGLMTSLLSFAAQITAAVFTCIWLARVLSNHRLIRRETFWSGGWGAGGWFLPPILYVIPLLMLREAWKASAPDVPAADQRWKQTSVSPVVWIWWILFGLVPLVFLPMTVDSFTGGFGDEEALAEGIVDNAGMNVVQSIALVAAAVAWIALVRQVTARHRQLTGIDRR